MTTVALITRRCLLAIPWSIRPSFPGLSSCHRHVAHALRTLAPVAVISIATYTLPLDLHVLSLPLAFILSQDQTLHCIYFYKCLALSCNSSSYLFSEYFYSKEFTLSDVNGIATAYTAYLSICCLSLITSMNCSLKTSSSHICLKPRVRFSNGIAKVDIFYSPPNFF